MYLSAQRSNKGTQAFGLVSAVALTAGMAALFTTMNMNVERQKQVRTELVLLSPPPPPPIEEPKLEVEVVNDTPAPPTPPPLVAPEIEFVPEELPVITAPVADPVPEPVIAAPSPAPVSQTRPRLIAGDKPAYPAASRRSGEQGTTRLEVCVNAGGRVTSVSVAGSSGYARLDDAAAKWIRGERFTPARVNGVPQDVCGYNVFYEWTLRDA